MKKILTFFIVLALITIGATFSNAQVQIGGDIIGNGIGSFSGISVAISDDGSIIAVGGDGKIEGVGEHAGCVQAYHWTNNAWAPLGKPIIGKANSDHGHSIALSADGTVLAIGAYSMGKYRGQVQVFKWKDNSWKPLGQIIDRATANNALGYAISLSADGNILAIGVPGHSHGEKKNIGKVQVYKLSSNQWTQMGKEIWGQKEEDELGWSLSLSDDGKTLGVGVPTNGSHHGHSAVYKFEKNAWTQMGDDIVGSEKDAQTGWSLSLSGDGKVVAIGIPFNDNKKGQVQVYEWSNKKWKQIGANINGAAAGDFLGLSLSLSAHGKALAVSSPIHNDKKGKVQVFERKENSWESTCELAGTVSGEATGYGLALSEDGSKIVVAAPFFEEGKGKVKVYRDLPTMDGAGDSTMDGDSTGIMGSTDGVVFNENTYYRLTNLWQGEGRSLDVHPEGKGLMMGVTSDATGQLWKIKSLGDGNYRLTNQWQGEGKSIDVVNDGKNNQLAMVDTGNYSGQVWKIEAQGDGTYRVTNSWQKDKSLDCESDKNGSGAWLAPIGNYSGQFWKITDTQ